jgi:hypothetical protein
MHPRSDSVGDGYFCLLISGYCILGTGSSLKHSATIYKKGKELPAVSYRWTPFCFLRPAGVDDVWLFLTALELLMNWAGWARAKTSNFGKLFHRSPSGSVCLKYIPCAICSPEGDCLIILFHRSFRLEKISLMIFPLSNGSQHAIRLPVENGNHRWQT